MKILKYIALTVIVVAVALAFSYKQIISAVLIPQYIEWAYETDKKGLEIGVPLNDKELLLASDIGIKHPDKVRLVYVDQVPFPRENFALKTLGEALGFIGEGIINNAQAFGYSIYIRNGYELTRPKLAHELVHVLQVERSSLEIIITQYFSDLEKYGYDNAPLEVEAYKANKKYSENW
ncbi:hypothetical protein [Flammeovirga sp. SJP92]|uniref:hypothetical protein n=1 Tax=Flammeovirga sp. SJP92 TaxID=1775430 RepID=UPI0007896972|nr:hypothetical protein [Flammeovirga sp. SJP92]KXX71151.1 hypothetical protein AVL50_09980 [Flammeovirga sp. SJP92]